MRGKMRLGYLGLAAAMACLGLSAAAAEFYAAPGGGAGGNGSKEKPWSLAVALKSPPAVKPGDTIWLAGGNYELPAPDGGFFATLTGTKEAPITVRAQTGARATVVIGSQFFIVGAFSVFRDIEFISTNPVRNSRPQFTIGTAEQGGAGVKAVNLIVHDTSNFGFWRSAVDAEIYGSLLYHNGCDSNGANSNGHGHGAYIQNVAGMKKFTDNIVFRNFSCGIAPHGSQGVIGLVVEGNAAFDNGVLSKTGHHYDFFIWCGKQTRQISWIGNYGYSSWTNGYVNNLVSGLEMTVKDNYLVGAGSVLTCGDWDQITMTGNKFLGADKLALMSPPVAHEANPKSNIPAFAGGLGQYKWDKNEYVCYGKQDKPFQIIGSACSFDDWKKRTGLDAGSTFSTERPKDPAVFIRPNKHEEGRANINVYNWPKKDAVDADVSKAGLKKGEKYAVQDAQDFFGKAVAEGTYDEKPISLPMTGLKPAQPTGDSFVPAKHTGPDFAVFVIRKAEQKQ
jgi:hypothetical protein